MRIKSVRIRDFKRIKDVELELDDVTLLVGGNNSGKSSAIQGVHFAVSCLRAAKANGKSENQPATTLGVNQFRYLPTNEIMRIRHSIGMTQTGGPHFDFEYQRDDGNVYTTSLHLYRGKNANVQLIYNSGNSFFRAAARNSPPFSVFVPGLAGVSLSEEYRANAIINVGLAQGDANLYLRNVLYRLCKNPAKLARFYNVIRPIFPGLDVTTQFDEDDNQFILADITTAGYKTPLELSGTGALQAIQVAAYVTLYEPALLLLDEPDAHLHPGNQKLLVDLIFEVAAQTATQIIMASHSRHVLDRVLAHPLGAVRWLKNGKLQDGDGADLSLLMDIGALDDFEELSKNRVKKLIFCEDKNTNKLEAFLESSGIDCDEVHVVPFNGIDNLAAARTVVDFFMGLGPDRRAVIYRDGDCMTEDEKTWLRGRAEAELPAGASLYISKFTDIEHYFCQIEHVKEIADISLAEAKEVVNKCIVDDQARLAVKVTNKRNDLKFKSQKGNAEFASTEKLLENGVPFDLTLGSLMLPKILAELAARGHGVESLAVPSAHIADFDFAALLD